ncbi:hypothetical protein ACFXGI_03095 [Streptomyces sp. NPDC059355]|uniref:hypothetical protein n=1 Tax=Streptomyces sp. NPDC059355 TaxID=3346811 RepID=UPI0036CC88AC
MTLLHEPGQAGRHPSVAQLQYGFHSGVVQGSAQAAQGVLVTDDQGVLAPRPGSRWRTVVTPSVDQGPGRTV